MWHFVALVAYDAPPSVTICLDFVSRITPATTDRQRANSRHGFTTATHLAAYSKGRPRPPSSTTTPTPAPQDGPLAAPCPSRSSSIRTSRARPPQASAHVVIDTDMRPATADLERLAGCDLKIWKSTNLAAGEGLEAAGAATGPTTSPHGLHCPRAARRRRRATPS